MEQPEPLLSTIIRFYITCTDSDSIMSIYAVIVLFVCVGGNFDPTRQKRDYANNLGIEHSLSLRENNEDFI